jgi:hypothetical protein
MWSIVLFKHQHGINESKMQQNIFEDTERARQVQAERIEKGPTTAFMCNDFEF